MNLIKLTHYHDTRERVRYRSGLLLWCAILMFGAASGFTLKVVLDLATR